MLLQRISAAKPDSPVRSITRFRLWRNRTRRVTHCIASSGVGTLEPDKLADVVAVDGNPRGDIMATTRVVFGNLSVGTSWEFLKSGWMEAAGNRGC
jgi:hypothetical protein